MPNIDPDFMDDAQREEFYRLFPKQRPVSEILAALAVETARADREALAHGCSEGVIHAVIHRIGGIVEGNPTGRHNFLQRVDALVEAEARADREAAARQEAERDRDELQALFCGVKEIHAVPGRTNAIFDGEGVEWFAKLVSQFFYQAGGKNYVEWQCSVDVAEFVLTCQRKSGKTPDDLKREAEAERDRLRAELAALRGTTP